MQLISLFSGIGGFELAAEWMGWDVIASCEINPFGQRVLKHYWPEAYHHDDIHTLNYETLKKQSRWNPTRPTILTGGFPCQPYSMAGKRRGKEDDRHLWPEMLRVIREVRPDYIVGENVLGLVSWDGGLVFDEVHSDLEAEGYEVQAVVIPAAAKNAPHGRDRVWFCARLVADCTSQRLERATGSGIQWSGNGFTGSNNGSITNTHSNGQQRSDCEHEKQTSEGWEYAQHDVEQVASSDPDCIGFGNRCEFNQPNKQGQFSRGDFAELTTNAKCIRLQRRSEAGNISETERTSCRKRGQFAVPIKADGGRYFPRTDWSNFPTESPVCVRNDGLSTELDGITFSKWRNESIKAAGNAIVPQVAYSIFKAIIQCENKE